MAATSSGSRGITGGHAIGGAPPAPSIITGTVYADNGSTPVPYAPVGIFSSTGTDLGVSGTANASGVYSIPVNAPGTSIVVRAGGTGFWGQTAAFTIAAGVTYTGKDIVEINSPSVSPSSSPSSSISPSASISPSLSVSKSPSASISPSKSPSSSASASPSVSPSKSPSVSPSASISPSGSPSVSPSVSPSKSPSKSPSASVSPSTSISPSLSPSSSVSPSPSPQG